MRFGAINYCNLLFVECGKSCRIFFSRVKKAEYPHGILEVNCRENTVCNYRVMPEHQSDLDLLGIPLQRRRLCLDTAGFLLFHSLLNPNGFELSSLPSSPIIHQP